MLALTELHDESDLSAARARLLRWVAPDDQQARTPDRIVAWIDAHPSHAHPRTLLPGHLTASALLVAPRGARESASGESHELAWVASGDLPALSADASVRRLFERVFAARA